MQEHKNETGYRNTVAIIMQNFNWIYLQYIAVKFDTWSTSLNKKTCAKMNKEVLCKVLESFKETLLMKGRL